MLPAAEGRSSPLFGDHTTLEIEFRGPIGAVLEAATEREEFSFTLTVGDAAPLPLEVAARGNSRLRLCRFPPLRLNFAKKAVGGTVFEGQDRLKLVTHCNDRRRDAGNVLEEYLGYRLFNLVSDLSYRVRLARITYVDTTRGTEAAQTRWGFMIESDEELSGRTGIGKAELAGIPYSRVDHQQAALVYVFQYLIGNTDWSLATALTDEHCCHNIEVFESAGRLLAVPYDFDLSGLVDASYAEPDPSLPIRNVRVRAYRGYCESREVLETALAAISAREADILRLAREAPADDEASRDQRVRYLGDFFEQAAEAKSLVDRFERRCL